MDKNIIVTLISSAVAISASIIALIQSWRIKKIEAQIPILTAAFGIEKEDYKQIEYALKNAWEQLQIVKEIIHKLLIPFRYDIDIARDHIKKPYKIIKDEYAKFGIIVPEQAKAEWHKSKKIIHDLDLLLEKELESNTDSCNLKQLDINLLKEYRFALTEIQNVIYKCRADIMHDKLNRILSKI